MPYGIIDLSIYDLIEPYIFELDVIDLCAGDLGHAKRLLSMKPSQLTALDINPMPKSTGIITINEDVANYNKQHTVAFLSWPLNCNTPGLVEFLKNIPVVIYMGSNIDGNSCGGPDLFRYFETRQPINHLHHRNNSVLIYGNCPRTLPLYAEEYAAISAWKGGQIMNWEASLSYNTSLMNRS